MQAVRPLFDGDSDTRYVESWQRRQDGEDRLLVWWCRALKDDSGQVTGALSTAVTSPRPWLAEAMRDARLRLLELAPTSHRAGVPAGRAASNSSGSPTAR